MDRSHESGCPGIFTESMPDLADEVGEIRFYDERVFPQTISNTDFDNALGRFSIKTSSNWNAFGDKVTRLPPQSSSRVSESKTKSPKATRMASRFLSVYVSRMRGGREDRGIIPAMAMPPRAIPEETLTTP